MPATWSLNMTIPFAIVTTAAQHAAAVSLVPFPSRGLEIRGSVAVQTEEGLSSGRVRKTG
ncbi:hypothetical protein C9427_32490 [Mesorhizobium helmanticense]|uniref:Uncharacterized protein n=1 Tax=Mesorhizobium helmanticense TaxID=1776423 RepID=A0A2T4IL34_9HYPH|nr:hypothetical protein C9427_32490 [Mesorhizobium helmanticense]